MVQYSHPGVYIEEFTPGSPIEGISTSTVAFLGTAGRGPAHRPTRLSSWDAFRSTFGDFLTGTPPSHLAPAVHGFFLNGGTDCFVLRVSTAERAHAELLGRPASSVESVLHVEAAEEGLAGDGITVKVTDNSLLARTLETAGAGATTLAVHFAASAVRGSGLATGPGADRRTVPVVDNRGFLVGEPVLLTAPDPAEPARTVERSGTVASLRGTDTVVLAEPVPGAETFVPDGTLRSADLRPGTRELRVRLPDGVRLEQALPRGATVSVTKGSATPDIRTVEASTSRAGGWALITLTEALAGRYVTSGAPVRVASLEFDLTVTLADLVRTYSLLSMNAEHPHHWSVRVPPDLVVLRDPVPPPAAPAADPRPRPAEVQLHGGADDDRAAAWAGLLAAPAAELAGLDPYGEIDLVCIPGATAPDAQKALVDYCEGRRDLVAILDSVPPGPPPPAGPTYQESLLAQVDGLRGGHLGFAALYCPWLRVRNPVTRRIELWPPSGHVAGVYARTDALSGVHTAPAGTNLRGVLGLERLLSNADQDPLNLAGVNALRVFPGSASPVVWGARTTATRNRYWQYVNIRRLFVYLEKSIELGIQWAVFRPNDQDLWQDLKRTVTDFLTRAWRDGALFGATAGEAFYVRIDEALNPEPERALGRLHMEVGVVPAYPAEFIVVRIGIWQGGSQVSEA
ncbi:phage tail sheath family protein [Streptomyces sp. NPDC004111]|uniref:phage tail sheath family protein n=1 Tax=Streptomyces sp. NPDC004111 TaxID=3364690 RepID=UPI0036CC6D9F